MEKRKYVFEPLDVRSGVVVDDRKLFEHVETIGVIANDPPDIYSVVSRFETTELRRNFEAKYPLFASHHVVERFEVVKCERQHPSDSIGKYGAQLDNEWRAIVFSECQKTLGKKWEIGYVCLTGSNCFFFDL